MALKALFRKVKAMSEEQKKQMEVDAIKLAAVPVPGKKCPVCGNKSIFTEPAIPAVIRPAIWSYLMLTRKPS